MTPKKIVAYFVEFFFVSKYIIDFIIILIYVLNSIIFNSYTYNYEYCIYNIEY